MTAYRHRRHRRIDLWNAIERGGDDKAEKFARSSLVASAACCRWLNVKFVSVPQIQRVGSGFSEGRVPRPFKKGSFVISIDRELLYDRPEVDAVLLDSLGFVDDQGRMLRSVDPTDIKSMMLDLAKAAAT